MTVYEVNLSVDPSVADDYAVWLEDHIAQILRIDGFVRASWFEVEGDAAMRGWTVHYYLRDRAALDNYFAHHAEVMRRDGLERFPGKFTATRRVMELRAELERTNAEEA